MSDQAETSTSDSITYFIPGMGASEIMFYKYRDLPIDSHFFNWIDPLKGESMKEYATRYVEMIDQSKKVNLVGVSFGGLLATEIAMQIKVNKLILISSMPSRSIQPFVMKLMRYVPIYKLIPPKKPPLNRKLLKYVFGIKKEADLDFFIQMISEFNFKYIKWAVSQLIEWEQDEPYPGAVHIVGDKDRLFRPGQYENEIVVSGGTHYMVVDMANKIKPILTKLILRD